MHRAQRTGGVATRGPYRYVRHPQYLGFIAIMVGFLIQWPTLITLLMFPILLRLYVRLARTEERSLQPDLASPGESVDWESAHAYAAYVARTPAFLPRLPGRRRGPAPGASRGGNSAPSPTNSPRPTRRCRTPLPRSSWFRKT
ncbi:MAG: methyltransferase family protein [Thermoleophilia bacterium]